MEDKLLRYTLRVDRRLFQKFRYIAEAEARSANKEIEQFLKKRVAEYEKENGKIDVPNWHANERNKRIKEDLGKTAQILFFYKNSGIGAALKGSYLLGAGGIPVRSAEQSLL